MTHASPLHTDNGEHTARGAREHQGARSTEHTAKWASGQQNTQLKEHAAYRKTGRAGARGPVPGPGAPSSPGAAAASPSGRPQSWGSAHQTRPVREHGRRSGARALGHCVLRSRAAAACNLADLAIGARISLPRADSRRPVPGGCAPLHATPAALAPLAPFLSQLFLLASVSLVEPVALGGLLGGFSFALGFFVYS